MSYKVTNMMGTFCKKYKKEFVRSILYELRSFKNEISLEPIQLPVCKLINVAISSTHFLAVTEDHIVYSWGENQFGQLGHGDQASWKYHPICINALISKNIQQVAAGTGFSIFLNNNAVLMSCGDGRQGCLGHGDWNSISQPRIITKMISVNILQIKSGTNHVLALSTNGELYSWGCGKDGRLGLGNEGHRYSPTLVNIPHEFTIKSIHSGADSSILITTSGQILASGLNTHNKLGLSSVFEKYDKSLYFKLVKIVTHKIKDVHMGKYHTALIQEDGTIITMGKNNEGQLGRGHCKPKNRLGQVVDLHRKIKTASCGSTYTVAGTVDNVVYLWGTRYMVNNKKISVSTESSRSFINLQPLQQTLLNIEQESSASTSGSVKFSSDIIKHTEMELLIKPKAILGLYASQKHIAAGELVWLVELFAQQTSIFIWVNTTAPPPIKNCFNKLDNQDMLTKPNVSQYTNFETLKKELFNLPNTPQPN